MPDFTRLEEWRKHPGLRGLLTDWSEGAAEEVHTAAGKWLTGLTERWAGIADLFATAPLWTARATAPGFAPVCFDAEGRLAAAGSADGTVRVWDVERQCAVAQFRAHQSEVTAIAFHPEGKMLATGSRDRTAKLWNVETGTLLQRLAGHIDDIEAVAFHPGGGMLATASRDGSAALWEIPGGAHIVGLVKWPPEYIAHGDRNVTVFPILCAAFGPDGAILATGSSSSLVLWDLENHKEVAVWRDHRGPVTAAAWSPDGRRLVSGGVDRQVRVWDPARRCPLGPLPAAAGTVRGLRVLDDGDTVVALIAPGALQLWSLARGRTLCTFCPAAEDVGAADLSDAAGLACLGMADGEVRFLQFAGGRQMLRDAARSLQTRREHTLAARCWETLEDWIPAAGQHARAGDDFAAAQFFARGKDHRRAAEAFLRAGAAEEAARAWTKAGDPLAAAIAWQAAGHPEPAIALYRGVLNEPGDPRSLARATAAWRLAALLASGPGAAEAVELARGARVLLAERPADLPADATLAALSALAAWGRAAGREAEVKEGFEAALHAPGLAPRDRVRLLEEYVQLAESFANVALREDAARRLDEARRSAEEAARVETERRAHEAAAELVAPAPAPPADRFVFLWHASATLKCARLLSELARGFPTEITLHASGKWVEIRRQHALAAFLTHRRLRGFEVEIRFKGENLKEAMAAVETLVRTHEAFQ